MTSLFLLVMLAVNSSPTKSESSSTSNTDDTSSSTQTVSFFVHRNLAYCQPPKSSAKDVADQAQSHRDESPTPNKESIEEEYTDGIDPWPKPKEGYTRRLIPMICIPFDEIDDDFDEDAFNKKSYPNIEIVDMHNVPKGWILVNRIPSFIHLQMIDPSPPTKIIKRWNPFDRDDPNLDLNLDRAQFGLPPIDYWNIGVEYTYKSFPTSPLS